MKKNCLLSDDIWLFQAPDVGTSAPATDAAHDTMFKKIPPDQKSFRDATKAILDREGELDAPLPPVAEQALELLDLFRRGDDQDLAQARHHQRGERIIDQPLVVDRK